MIDTDDKLKIIARGSQPFTDRHEAGALLAEALLDLKQHKPLVLGIPRGGLLVAREVASRLDGELDIMLTRKLRAPQNPELAIGAMTEDGQVFLDEDLAVRTGATSYYLQKEKNFQFNLIHGRKDMYRKVRPKLSCRGRHVIIIDDGVATGATLQAALWSARQDKPAVLIAATPIGAEETLRKLAASADRVVCLRVPDVLYGVGNFYIHFDQTSDEEVVEVLEACQRKR
jgi:predicted phosphoribosyltransferase